MKKMTKCGKSILLSALAAMAFGGIAVGTTYALFTSEAKTDVTVTSGKVSISTSVEDIKLYSLNETSGETELINSQTTFTNGGSFAYDSTTGGIALDKFTPGDKVEFTIKAVNDSNVNIKVRSVMKTLSDNGLIDGLVVTINGEVYDGSTTVSEYVSVAKDAELPTSEYKFSIELPADKGNQYQDKTCELSFKLEAVQGNAKVEDVDDSTYAIYTSTDLTALAKKANAGTYNYDKVILMNDIDMDGVNYVSPTFGTYDKLEFDGNGKTIKNLTASVGTDGINPIAGLIGHAAKETTIYNVSFENAKIEGTTEVEDPAICAGIVVGYTDNGKLGGLSIKNVSVKNSSVSKVKWAGGIIGYTSAPDVTLSDITLENVSVSSYTCGGLIGQIGGMNTTINGVKGSGVTVDGIKREGGMVGAVSGASLDVTYDETKYSSTLSEEAIANRGSVAGLTGANTMVNGKHYYTANSDAELKALAQLSNDKASIIEIGAGTYNGYSLTTTKNISAGVEIVGRGDKNKVKWIQATENNNNDAGYSFQGSKLTMKNLTLTSTANGYYTGFPHVTGADFEDVKILVDHEGGAMGYWGDGDVSFTNCEFDSTNGEESNMYAYGGKNFTFKGCDFTSDETAIKLYREVATAETNVDVLIDDCTFNNVHNVAWDETKTYKTALQLDSNSSSDMIHYNIVMNNSTVSGNYSSGILTGVYKGLIGVRTVANIKARNATLTIDTVEQDLGLAE